MDNRKMNDSTTSPMMIFRFAFKNMAGAGLRTWLNTIVLALVFIIIILLQGVYDGFQRQIERVRIADETGRFQLWNQEYDSLDPLSFRDNHGTVPAGLEALIKRKQLTVILTVSGIIYPKGRLQPVIIKGISPKQTVLGFPTHYLDSTGYEFPAMIGRRMAEQLGLGKGDTLVMRWRTVEGAIDARDLQIVHVFDTEAPAIDLGHVWVPLNQMQSYLNAPDQASILVGTGVLRAKVPNNWRLLTEDELLSDTRKMIDAKRGGANFLYLILMFLALISLLDTQMLSIFRRRTEVGLLLALGLTQRQVVGLFTIEGALQGVLASLAVVIIGGPVFWYLSTSGIHLTAMDQFGLAGSSVLYPYFSGELIVGTFLFMMTVISLVSYWPARKIGKLAPAQALRGNWL